MKIKKLKDYGSKNKSRVDRLTESGARMDLDASLSQLQGTESIDEVIDKFLKAVPGLNGLEQLYIAGEFNKNVSDRFKDKFKAPLIEHLTKHPEQAYNIQDDRLYYLQKDAQIKYANDLLSEYKNGDTTKLLDALKTNSKILYDLKRDEREVDMCLAAMQNGVDMAYIPRDVLKTPEFLDEAVKIDHDLYINLKADMLHHLPQQYNEAYKNATKNRSLEEAEKYSKYKLGTDGARDNILKDRVYLQHIPAEVLNHPEVMLRAVQKSSDAIYDVGEELFRKPKFIARALTFNQNALEAIVNRANSMSKQDADKLLKEAGNVLLQEHKDFILNMSPTMVQTLGLGEQRKQLEQQRQAKQNVGDTRQQPKQPADARAEGEKQNAQADVAASAENSEISGAQQTQRDARRQHARDQQAQQEQEAKDRMDQRLQGIKPERQPQNEDEIRKARAQRDRDTIKAMLSGERERQERIAALQQRRDKRKESKTNAADAQVENAQTDEVRAKKASKNTILGFLKKAAGAFRDMGSKIFGSHKQDNQQNEQTNAEPEMTIEKLEELNKAYKASQMEVDLSNVDISKFADQDWLMVNATNPEIWRAAAVVMGQSASLLQDLKSGNVHEMLGGENPIISAKEPSASQSMPDLSFDNDDMYYQKQQGLLSNPFVSDEIKNAIRAGKSVNDVVIEDNIKAVHQQIGKLCSSQVLGDVQGELLTGYNSDINDFLKAVTNAALSGNIKNNEHLINLKKLNADLKEKHDDLLRKAINAEAEIERAELNKQRLAEQTQNAPEQEQPKQPEVAHAEPENSRLEEDQPEIRAQQPAQEQTAGQPQAQPEREAEQPATEVEADKPQVQAAQPQNVQPEDNAGQPENTPEAAKPKKSFIDGLRDIFARVKTPKTTNQAQEPAQEQPAQPEVEVETDQPKVQAAQPQNVQPQGRGVQPAGTLSEDMQKLRDDIVNKPAPDPQLAQQEAERMKQKRDYIFSEPEPKVSKLEGERLQQMQDHILSGATQDVIDAWNDMRKRDSGQQQASVQADNSQPKTQDAPQADSPAADDKQQIFSEFEEKVSAGGMNGVPDKYWSNPEFIEWFATNKIDSKATLYAFIDKFDVDVLEDEGFKNRLSDIVGKQEDRLNSVGQKLTNLVAQAASGKPKVEPVSAEDIKKARPNNYKSQTQISHEYKVGKELAEELLDDGFENI